MTGLAQRVLAGDVRAASRLIRDIEDGGATALSDLRSLLPNTGKAVVVGVTGPPGAGKSTLVDRLIARFRARGQTVGVLAVDPTSPFTGGALLGDRIRMQGHAQDPGVFIRSLATRGSLGGLSRATADCVRVLDAMGRDIVLIETVGVGQDEVEVAGLADTTLVVLVPGMGDDIQASKAGLLEVADVFVVNKSDLPGADKVVRELEQTLELRHATQDASLAAEGWIPPVVKVTAANDGGMGELLQALDRHWEHLVHSKEREAKARRRAATHLLALLKERLVAGAVLRLERDQGKLEDIAARIARGEADPYALADELSRELLGG